MYSICNKLSFLFDVKNITFKIQFSFKILKFYLLFKSFTQISGNWKILISGKSWINSSICLFLLLRNSFFFKETSKKGWILRVHSLNQQQQKSLVRSDFYDLLITDKNSILCYFYVLLSTKTKVEEFFTHISLKEKHSEID